MPALSMNWLYMGPTCSEWKALYDEKGQKISHVDYWEKSKQNIGICIKLFNLLGVAPSLLVIPEVPNFCS